MPEPTEPVVTRFAPSPTGFLHIGGVRTALFAWLYARKHGGKFILRIEDTDKARQVEGSIEHIQESLQWLKIDWDEFYLQSDRLDIYKKYALELVERGLAYPDPYTDEEVQGFREAAQAEKRPFLFRNHRPKTFAAWDGTRPLRLKVSELKRYTWHDAVRGELSAGEEMLDDIILIKADGYPTYNFAHIVDDIEMGVTHVMRGEEFIASTPKFLSIYDALEKPYPIFVTLPPIMGPDGKKKLSKRDGAKDLLEYDREGYLPETMVNFLALIGWNPGTNQELFSKEELTDAFSLEKIQHHGGAFDEEKLKWMNREYLLKLEPAVQVAFFIDGLPDVAKNMPQYSDKRAAKLAPVVFERTHTKVEIREAAGEGDYDWAFATPQPDAKLIKWKNDATPAAAIPRLQKTAELLEKNDFSGIDVTKSAIWDYADETGRGEVLWPLRVALTGRERSPDPFTCLYVLGKEESLARIGNAITALEKA